MPIPQLPEIKAEPNETLSEKPGDEAKPQPQPIEDADIVAARVQERELTCANCPYTVVTRHFLLKHAADPDNCFREWERIASGSKRRLGRVVGTAKQSVFQCPGCPFNSIRKMYMDRHWKKRNPDGSCNLSMRQSPICQLCRRHVWGYEALRTHCVEEHRLPVGPWPPKEGYKGRAKRKRRD